MRMIGQQHPCITGSVGFWKQYSQTFKKMIAILIIFEDVPPLYPPDYDVVDYTRSIQTR